MFILHIGRVISTLRVQEWGNTGIITIGVSIFEKRRIGLASLEYFLSSFFMYHSFANILKLISIADWLLSLKQCFLLCGSVVLAFNLFNFIKIIGTNRLDCFFENCGG
jgi:hypothetical protein